MRKRLRMAVGLLVVGALGIAGWLILREREPIYQGKPLSFWLENDDGSLKAELNAQEAVLAAGTNAVPTLLRMLCTSDSPLKRKVIDLAQNQRYIKIHWVRAESRNAGAWVGFTILGPRATFAVRSLVEIFDYKISWWSQLYTIKSLAAIGPAANVATPVLLRATTNSHFLVRAESVYALAHIHSGPDLAVPAMSKALSDANGTVRLVACRSLAQLGEEAKQAVPALVKTLDDPVRDVRHSAADALRYIDPEGAAKAGMK